MGTLALLCAPWPNGNLGGDAMRVRTEWLPSSSSSLPPPSLLSYIAPPLGSVGDFAEKYESPVPSREEEEEEVEGEKGEGEA